MQDTLVKPTVLKGGEFLIKDAAPEKLSSLKRSTKQQMIADMVRDFSATRFPPNIYCIEKQEEG